jgi:cytochrome c553
MKWQLFAVTLVASLCFAQAGVAEEKVGNSEWKARMQAMLTDVLQLLPFAFDERKFNDEKNRAEIKKALDALANHSSALKAHTAKFKSLSNDKIDPSVRFIAEAFENEVGAAQISFSGSDQARRHSQTYLRSAVSKCSACHSQSSNGPELRLDQFKLRLEGLNAPDRYLALVATRQFDEALAEFSKNLKTPQTSGGDELSVDRTAKSALAIAVRVKRDPKLTLKLIQDIEASGRASKMLQNDLPDWRTSTMEWQKAPPLNSLKEPAVLAEAKRLLATSRRKERTLGHFQNSDVATLRASTLLHDLLSNFPRSKNRGEIYILLAEAYDLLPGYALWDLPDEYLAACIQENPHSKMSESCFDKYRSNIVMGYSGSSGTNIPSAVQQHIDRMKALSERASK